jgi:molybdopterin-guanine dinucleotide biosynthesis protein B
MPTRVVAVVGYRGAGKTKVVEGIVRGLTSKGYRVGTLKHATPHHILDTPGKDTWRHRRAGAEASAIIADGRVALFLDRTLAVAKVLRVLGPLEFAIFEGFKSIDHVPRIIVPKDRKELEVLANGLEIAVVSEPSLVEGVEINVPTLGFDEMEELSSLVEAKSLPLLPGLNCGRCGYESCKRLAEAALREEADVSICAYLEAADVELLVDGRRVLLNPYVRSVFRGVLLALVDTLKGCEGRRRVEVRLEVEGDA